MAIVKLENLSKQYGEGDHVFFALKNVNLEIEQGKFVVILGPSGAGKSTLLNLIGGLDNPTSGNIIVNDVNISSYNDNQLADYRANTVGFIFQFYNLIPTLTAIENISLVKEIAPKALDPNEMLEAVGLLDHANQFPNQLSGGEQQRVSIARALAKNSDIILCDEPTGALDSKTGVMVLNVLKNMCKKYQKTIIIVTHNSSIAKIADVIIHVKNGEVISCENNLDIKDVNEVEW